MWYSHQVNPLQFAGLIFVFMAVLAEVYSNNFMKKPETQTPELNQELRRVANEEDKLLELIDDELNKDSNEKDSTDPNSDTSPNNSLDNEKQTEKQEENNQERPTSHSLLDDDDLDKKMN